MLEMLAAFPQPGRQFVTAGARRNLRSDTHGNSFGNANTTVYLEVHTPQPLIETDQARGGFSLRNTREASSNEHKFHHNFTEAQINACIPGSLPRTAHDSKSTQAIDLFRLTTPFQNFGVWLQESLQELAECPSYAQEEEMDEPSNLAMTKARELLRRVAQHVIDRPEVYPMQESCIAIDFRTPGSMSGVLFLIENDGSGALYHRTANSKGRLRVDDAADLLGEGGFRELKRVGIR